MGKRTATLTTAAALALMAALPRAASSQDLGVPRDGFDRVLLDDGRVVDARVLPREKEVVPLEFADGTLRVDRSRVREVRFWRDFDPAPRDDAEREKAAKGFVRWKGTLVPPAHAAKERAREVEEEAAERAKAEAALSWENRVKKDAGKFDVVSNAPPAEREAWCVLLGALSARMVEAFPGAGRWASVHIYLYRDEASRAAQKKEDDRQAEYEKVVGPPEFYAPDHPTRRVDVVLAGARREDLVPVVFRHAALRLFDEWIGYRSEELGGWVQFGVPAYFAASTMEDGKLKVGLVDDLLLLLFRELEEKGKSPSIDAVLRAGNEYWKEAWDRDGPGKYRASFDVEHLPFAWLLVDTILDAEDGKYRGGLTNWVKFWLNVKIGPMVEAKSDYGKVRARLLQYLKLKDFDPLLAAMRRNAASMELRLPASWLYLARQRAAGGKPDSGALLLVEKAVTLSGRDAGRLREAAEVCAALPGGRERAVGILRQAVEADPLDAGAREALARLLEGEEAAREAALAAALKGSPPVPPPGR
ncbi:MAG: hypothetical protein L6R43_12170 [Planctomycetes bacterium]|nr:hypothetical protein [Planctomycetota bacterium]